MPGSLEESALWEQVAERRDAAEARGAAVGRREGDPAPLDRAGRRGLAPCRRPEARAARRRPLGLRAGRPTRAARACATGPRPHARSIASSRRRSRSEGLTLGPEADRATLIRRLSFDLTGLPPTPEEIDAFLADTRPDAYERLVDRLLASPRYGERWGKYWLDASGYADSNGYFSADSDRPLAYRYRDYVIRAFNADRPLDQFVREQLAGDELAGYEPGGDVTPAIVDQLVATHFLRNGQDGTGESDGNPDEVRADRYAVLEGAVQIIGSSLLGLTLQCAKCHDHKFEPVTQKEYYQLQAILYPAFNVEQVGQAERPRGGRRPRDELVAPWEAHEKAIDAEVARLKKELAPEPNDPPKEKEAKQKALDKAIEQANAKRRPHPGRIAWVGRPVGPSRPRCRS